MRSWYGDIRAAGGYEQGGLQLSALLGLELNNMLAEQRRWGGRLEFDLFCKGWTATT